MSLISFGFLAFFAIIVVAYYCFPWKYRWVLLLGASVYFYVMASAGTWWKVILCLAYGVVVSYFGALLIEKSKYRDFFMTITIILMFFELFFIKYLFNVGNIFIRIFNIDTSLNFFNFAAPIGISYFTLSAMGYVIDVHRKTCKAEPNILKHALFVCYFPEIISGPITRYSEMSPQFFSRVKLDYNNVTYGMRRMIWGYFKKLVIADNLAIVVSTVYGNYMGFHGIWIIIATLAYAFQLYTDFSGCMDIVLGASECLGIRLPENFNAPFFSRSLPEFWRRWHITLGLWFKDYVLYPILKSDFIQFIGTKSKKIFGKKIGKKIPTIIGLIIIWLLIGLWHGGTTIYFVASGGIPCGYLILSEIFQPIFKKFTTKLNIKTECTSYKLFQRFRTILLMCVCWLFVCVGTSFLEGVQVFKYMICTLNPLYLFGHNIGDFGFKSIDLVAIIMGLAALFFVDTLQDKGIDIRQKIDEQNILFKWIIIWLELLGLMFFGRFGQSAFIYFKF